MTNKHINYEKLIDISMHTIVKEALKCLKDNPNNIDHHFYLSFLTYAPAVRIPDYLRIMYPQEMTIVLQYQFEDLEIRKDDFSVSLTFNGKKANLSIPYKALTSFTDPTVNFGIKFKFFEKLYKNKKEEITKTEIPTIKKATHNNKITERKRSSTGKIIQFSSIKTQKK